MINKYFGIVFPNSITIMVKTDIDSDAAAIINELNQCSAVIGYSGAHYNPKSYIYVSEIIPDTRTKLMSKSPMEVFV